MEKHNHFLTFAYHTRIPFIMRQPREKSPGLKILWIWTFGTAASTFLFLPFHLLSNQKSLFSPKKSVFSFLVAVLIANVMRTSIRDFQNVLNAEQQQQQQNQQQNDNVVIDDSRVSEERVVED